MNNTPAELIAAFFVARGVAVRPANGTISNWPVTVGAMPSEGLDNYISVTDTGGELDGRIHQTGETINHHTFQVRTRSLSYPTARNKLGALYDELTTQCHRFPVTIGINNYVIQAVTITIAPSFIGQEEQGRRQHFTLNGKLTLAV